MAEPSTSLNQNHTSTTATKTTTATTTTTTTTTPPASSWGTLEELLLASAVHRYGTNSWDSIAKELQNRTTFSLLTPIICQQKYRDLKRRFATAAAAETAADADDSAAWLDELRRLRVAELRRELQRYDLSIVSLQLKVKRLKEERESSGNDKNVKEHGINDEDENDGVDKDEFDPQNNEGEKEKKVGNENENENAITENFEVKNEPDEPVEPEETEPVEPVGGACNSAESTRSNSRRRERVDSDELVESVAESKDDGGGGGGGGGGGETVKKESSDVQSTVSLWRIAANINSNDDDDGNDNDNNGSKKNDNDSNGGGGDGGGGKRSEKRKVVFSGTSSGEENQSAVVKTCSDGKSEALVEFMEVVRGRKSGSFFERRLLSQETPRYSSLVKQHIDLGIIQKRLDEGQYSVCQTKFYRDFMLLINNAIIFFAKRSSEHKAALELRQLLNKQFQSHVSSPHDHKSNPSKPAQPASLPKLTKPEPNKADPTDFKQPKLTITGPVIACRKRSSIAGKSSRVERKEISLGLDEKLSSLGEKVKQQGQKASSTSFNAVTKKRTRDQSFGSRSSSSKSNRNPSLGTPISAKGESSEAKVEKKKPSPGNSSGKMKQGLGSGSIKGTLLVESLKISDRRKSGNDSSGSKVKSDRRKDEGHKNGSGSKHGKEKAKGKEEKESTVGREKAKGKEERESTGSRSNRRPPKRAAAIAAMSKRGRDSGEAETQSKKRQRK